MRFSFVLGVVLAVLLLGAPMAQASTIFFDGFEDPDPLGNWSSRTGLVEVLAEDAIPGLAADGNYINMDGFLPQAGRMVLTQNINFGPGKYTLFFDLAGNQQIDGEDTLLVSINGIFTDESFTVDRNDPFETILIEFTVETGFTSTGIEFRHDGIDRAGPLLDNVKLTAVPLPAGVWLLGAGLGALGVLRRKRG